MAKYIPRNILLRSTHLHILFKSYLISSLEVYPFNWDIYIFIVTRRTFVIQIKICAECRDMLLRPRLVCQDPGLSGVPDKSSRGLGSMSRYSAHILICFIAYIFRIYTSAGLVGNFARLLPCHCSLLSEWGWSSENQSSQHALLVCSWPMLILSGIDASGLVKLIDKMGEICINGKLSAQEPREWRVFCIPVSNFTVFLPRI